MGDTGSLALGFLLGYLAIRHSLMTPGGTMSVRPLLLPISVLFIPAFDVARVMLSRKLAGKPLFMPDRSHIHHKLIDGGCSRRCAMIFIVVVSNLVLFLNMTCSLWFNINLILAADVVLAILFNIALDRRIKKKRTSTS
jgi:UDP-N-acetylmuramyl pentapeptide phosphotransferase/UDP-N-acetylglucosamine-1-phosphate transferase